MSRARRRRRVEDIKYFDRALIITPHFSPLAYHRRRVSTIHLSAGALGHNFLRRSWPSKTRPAVHIHQSRTLTSQLSFGTFKYDGLRKDGSTTTRLLELLPGSGYDPLWYKLDEFAFSSGRGPTFESLPYAWGNPIDQCIISCNNQVLSVPTNLAEALQALRCSERSRVLSADAICINRKDEEEKGKQVQLMRKIYSSADRTLVWLGHRGDRHEKGISKAATLFLEIGLWILQKSVSMEDCPTISVWYLKRNRTRVLLLFSGELYIAIISMLKRPWFQRAWVVQEVVVSKRATSAWDHAEFDWDDLVKVILYMAHQHFPPSFFSSLQHVASIEDERCTFRDGTESLLGVLLRHQRRHATDPRDKVHWFCGILQNVGMKSLVPVSYTESSKDYYPFRL